VIAGILMLAETVQFRLSSAEGDNKRTWAH